MSGQREATAEEAWEIARWGGDRDWWEVSGNCGGCGDEKCHEGRPCTGDDCQLCPNRNPASVRAALLGES